MSALLRSTCAADVNGDGTVGLDDFMAVVAPETWGPCPAPPDGCPADVNGDGIVGILDVLQTLADWGGCP